MNFLILSASFFLWSFSGYGQPNETAGIKQILLLQEEAWNRGDIDSFMNGYWNNDSLLFIGSKGLQYGYKNTLKRYKDTYNSKEKMGLLNFEIIQIVMIAPDTGRVLGKWNITRSPDNIGGYFTLLVKKLNGVWKIIYDHTS